MIFLKRISYFFIIIILFTFSSQNVSAYSATSSVDINVSDSNLSYGETAAVTFTFLEKPFNFTLGDVVSTGGTLSNLTVTGDPLVYTATLTPHTSNSSGNTLSVSMNPTFVTYDSVVAGAWNLAYDNAGSMWVTNYFSNDISKVAYDGTVTNYSGTGFGPRGIAFDGTNMWTANVTSNSVTKIAPNGSMTSYGGAISTPMDIAYDGTNMWTVNNDSTISKITPDGDITTYTGIGSNSTGIAFDGTNMWTVSFGDNSVTKVAPNGSTTTYTGTGDHSFSIAFDGTNMWTGNYSDNSVTKITPTGTMTTYPGLQSAGYDITFDGTNLWVASVIGVSKVTLDGQITNYTDISMYGASGIAINTDDGSIWTANYNHSTASKVGFTSGISSVYNVNTATRRSGGYPSPVFLALIARPAENLTPSVPDVVSPSQIPNPDALNKSEVKHLFLINMKQGSSTPDVKLLQEFLKGEGEDIYPEGTVNGYFGKATKRAVIRFQEKYFDEILKPLDNKKGTGLVYEFTRKKINSMISELNKN